jgi:hypothetical protein
MEGGILGEGMRTLNVTWVAWVLWNGKIALVQGTIGEGEEERNYWGILQQEHQQDNPQISNAVSRLTWASLLSTDQLENQKTLHHMKSF